MDALLAAVLALASLAAVIGAFALGQLMRGPKTSSPDKATGRPELVMPRASAEEASQRMINELNAATRRADGKRPPE